ncbi:MAG: hypothetical protein D6795_08830 [Deltaproteobacteria bacterium]|nr:MAG: hypothetical protein D6795_08830 [Deltaproteobacteria bacterium]
MRLIRLIVQLTGIFLLTLLLVSRNLSPHWNTSEDRLVYLDFGDLANLTPLERMMVRWNTESTLRSIRGIQLTAERSESAFQVQVVERFHFRGEGKMRPLPDFAIYSGHSPIHLAAVGGLDPHRPLHFRRRLREMCATALERKKVRITNVTPGLNVSRLAAGEVRRRLLETLSALPAIEIITDTRRGSDFDLSVNVEAQLDERNRHTRLLNTRIRKGTEWLTCPEEEPDCLEVFAESEEEGICALAGRIASRIFEQRIFLKKFAFLRSTPQETRPLTEREWERVEILRNDVPLAKRPKDIYAFNAYDELRLRFPKHREILRNIVNERCLERIVFQPL